jgi:glycosyltransferase involved in cell wall biosynthesis
MFVVSGLRSVNSGYATGFSSTTKQESSTLMNIAYITHVRFWTFDNASKLRVRSIIQYLIDQGCVVHIAFLGRISTVENQLIADLKFANLYVESILPEQLPKFSQLPHLRMLLREVPLTELARSTVGKCLQKIGNKLTFTHFDTTKNATLFRLTRFFLDESPYELINATSATKLVNLIDAKKIDACIYAYIKTAWLHQLVNNKKIPAVIDANDVIFKRRDSFIKNKHVHQQYSSRRLERHLLKGFKSIYAIQHTDCLDFAQLSPKFEVKTMMQPFLTHACSRLGTQVPNFGFLGSAMSPNREAVDYLVTVFWPALLKLRPDYQGELLIAGGVSKHLTASYDRVRVLGFVDELHTFYDQVDVVMATIKFGGGLKFKTIEAMAYSKAVIATASGVEGLLDNHIPSVLVSEQLEDWLAEASQLISDASYLQAKKTSAQAVVAQYFSAKKIFQPLLDDMKA